jgi:hypothetical protein
LKDATGNIDSENSSIVKDPKVWLESIKFHPKFAVRSSLISAAVIAALLEGLPIELESERRLLNLENIMRKKQLRNSDRYANCNNLNREHRDNQYCRDNESDEYSDYIFQLKLIPAYGQWIRHQWNNGWDVFFFTFVFKQLPGPRDAKVTQMFQEVTRVYGRLATRMVRKPRSPRWAAILPRGVFVADRPIHKDRDHKQQLRHVRPNDGLHIHGLVAANRLGRIRDPLDQHFREHMHDYLIDKIAKIDVRPVTNNPSRTTQYGAKGLKRRTFSSDDVLILPKTLDELADKRPKHWDPIKHIQAATNVSDEFANQISHDPKLVQALLGKR